MARSVAEARISFGLVSIPVHLYVATQPHGGLGFNMLHEKCGTRIKQQLHCPTCAVAVERADTVKGYEFEKGKFVRFSPDELKALEEESSQEIDIVEFVPVAAIDPVYYDKTYYLGSGKRGEKPYQLLAEALVQSGRVGVGTYSARGRNYLVMVRPRGAKAEDGLVMQELLYADEVRDFADVPRVPAEVTDKEVQLALQIIDQGANETFDPKAYKDERREQINALIEQKIASGGFHVPEKSAPAASEGGEVIDLVAALQASLAKRGIAPKKLERLPPQRAAAAPAPAVAKKKKKSK